MRLQARAARDRLLDRFSLHQIKHSHHEREIKPSQPRVEMTLNREPLATARASSKRSSMTDTFARCAPVARTGAGGTGTRPLPADDRALDRHSAPPGLGPTGDPIASPRPPPLATAPAVAAQQLPTTLGNEGAAAGPGQCMCVGHHLAQTGQVENRKVIGASRLATVRAGAAPVEAGQLRRVGGTDKLASRGTEHPPNGMVVDIHTIAGAVLPLVAMAAGTLPPQAQIWRSTPAPDREFLISKTVHTIVTINSISQSQTGQHASDSFLLS